MSTGTDYGVDRAFFEKAGSAFRSSVLMLALLLGYDMNYQRQGLFAVQRVLSYDSGVGFDLKFVADAPTSDCELLTHGLRIRRNCEDDLQVEQIAQSSFWVHGYTDCIN